MLTLVSTASAEWKEKVLYSFQGGGDNGSVPVGGVVSDQQGNLYGVTSDGGGVYQLVPPAQKGGNWTESVLYIFQGNTKGDGATPEGGLIIDGVGKLYGTTAYGGTGNCVLLGNVVGCGTVYELSPPAQKDGQWTETVLYSFPTATQGYFPWGDLVFDRAGNLYGATAFGGSKGTTCDKFYGGQCGVVFQLSPPKAKGGAWTEKVLYDFAGIEAGHNFGDGASPNGGLVLDSKGAVYGTTYYGGNNVKGECQGGTSGTGCGIVFELTPPSRKGAKWTKKVLHQFDGHDGSNSSAGVVFDRIGNLYGTTSGGPGPYGLVFELKKPSGNAHSWTESVLHAFSGGSDGGNPAAGLLLDSHGDLYGTASVDGGGAQYGTVFRLKQPIRKGGDWTLKVLYAFPGVPDGRIPTANLIFDRAGNLYSTTTEGGTGTCGYFGCGTVFEVSP
jgi:hypothetical protein